MPGSDVNAPVAAPIEGAVARVNEALGARECVVTVTCFDGLQLTLLVSDRYSNLCAALRFAGPSYTQLDWWFDASGHTLRAYRLLRWVKHNQRVYQHWSMDEDEFEDELLFAFEPKHFKDKARYIIAEGLEVDTSVSGVP